MEGLLFLIPIALGLGLVGLIAFMWSVRSGQFDDLEGAAHRVLFDEDGNEKTAPEDAGEAGAAAENSRKTD